MHELHGRRPQGDAAKARADAWVEGARIKAVWTAENLDMAR